jgi:thioredoxin-related protein
VPLPDERRTPTGTFSEVMMRFTFAFALILATAVSGWAEPIARNKPLPANPNLKPVTVQGLDWTGDLASALAVAAKEKKLVFIDFTGVTCLNCKINEKNVFSKAEVKEQFKRYVRVQLYTDTIPEEFYKTKVPESQRDKDAEANLGFQTAAFAEETLPYYVIIKPGERGTFEKVAAYGEGKINKVDKFIEFLKKALDGK